VSHANISESKQEKCYMVTIKCEQEIGVYNLESAIRFVTRNRSTVPPFCAFPAVDVL